MKQKTGYTENLRQEFYSFATAFRSVLKNVNYNIVTRDHVSGYDTEHDTRFVAQYDFCITPKTKRARNHCTPLSDGASESGYSTKNQLTNPVSASII